MKFFVHTQTLKNWMKENSLHPSRTMRPEDFASLSGLSIGTVHRALQGKGISHGTLIVLSQVTKLTESQLLAKSKGQKIGGAA